MQIRCTLPTVAAGIAEVLDRLYPSYRHEVKRERGCRTYTIRVYCKATGALLLTRAEV